MEHKIVDPVTLEDLPVGETGELWLRGYSLMLGLHKRERADVFTPDGWYRTGDGGHFDEDGHFYFTGRMGDLIKSAGMNITPRDVELVLEAMPEVVMAFVTGIDAGERGQDVVAAIALRPGETLDEDEARKRVKEEIASYKVPRHIAVFADQTELPWLDSGKVDRRRLTAILDERFREALMRFDPYSTEFFEDPWEMYRWLRDEAPVYHDEELGFYAVSRYDDCVEVHRDVATYTSTQGVSLDQLRSADFGRSMVDQASIIMMDPPDARPDAQAREPGLHARAASPSGSRVVQRVIGGLPRRPRRGRAPSTPSSDFAAPFPVEVICEIVGVPGGRPPADPPLDRRHARAGGRQPVPHRRRASRAPSRSAGYMDAARRRQAPSPPHRRHDQPPHRRPRSSGRTARSSASPTSRSPASSLLLTGRRRRDGHQAGGQRA